MRHARRKALKSRTFKLLRDSLAQLEGGFARLNGGADSFDIRTYHRFGLAAGVLASLKDTQLQRLGMLNRIVNVGGSRLAADGVLEFALIRAPELLADTLFVIQHIEAAQTISKIGPWLRSRAKIQASREELSPSDAFICISLLRSMGIKTTSPGLGVLLERTPFGDKHWSSHPSAAVRSLDTLLGVSLAATIYRRKGGTIPAARVTMLSRAARLLLGFYVRWPDLHLVAESLLCHLLWGPFDKVLLVNALRKLSVEHLDNGFTVTGQSNRDQKMATADSNATYAASLFSAASVAIVLDRL